MKELRGIPFIWPSWLAKLISGSDQCEWKFWTKAHYKFSEKSSEFSLTAWSIKHNQLVKTRRNGMEKLGYEVFIEDQNSFKLERNEFVISGKPDLIAIDREKNIVIVEDCKSGKPRPEHAVQVMLYMMLLPIVLPEQYKDVTLYGTVVYKSGVKDVDITDDMIGKELRDAVWGTVRQITGDESGCHRVQSFYECQFCEVPDCPVKQV